MYPQYQFLGQKGFCDIIIRPQAQPEQAVIVLIPGGEKQNGHLGLLPESAEQGKSVPVRKHDIQDHKLRLLL